VRWQGCYWRRKAVGQGAIMSRAWSAFVLGGEPEVVTITPYSAGGFDQHHMTVERPKSGCQEQGNASREEPEG